VPQPPRRPPVLNTLKDIGLASGICWTAHLPPVEQARPGMRVSVMLTFTKTGEILGEPRFTFVTREASPETRALYQRVAAAAIGTCTPLPFSKGSQCCGRTSQHLSLRRLAKRKRSLE